jgi:hypothetical protein
MMSVTTISFLNARSPTLGSSLSIHSSFDTRPARHEEPIPPADFKQFTEEVFRIVADAAKVKARLARR